MGVAAKQVIKTGKKTEITVMASSETDVRNYRAKFPGYTMSRLNLGPTSIKLTFRRV